MDISYMQNSNLDITFYIKWYILKQILYKLQAGDGDISDTN